MLKKIVSLVVFATGFLTAMPQLQANDRPTDYYRSDRYLFTDLLYQNLRAYVRASESVTPRRRGVGQVLEAGAWRIKMGTLGTTCKATHQSDCVAHTSETSRRHSQGIC